MGGRSLWAKDDIDREALPCVVEVLGPGVAARDKLEISEVALG
jgi:hypothetical protein